jgi:hypothetical protein
MEFNPFVHGVDPVAAASTLTAATAESEFGFDASSLTAAMEFNRRVHGVDPAAAASTQAAATAASEFGFNASPLTAATEFNPRVHGFDTFLPAAAATAFDPFVDTATNNAAGSSDAVVDATEFHRFDTTLFSLARTH